MRGCGTFVARDGRFDQAETDPTHSAAAVFSKARTGAEAGLNWMKRARKACLQSRGGGWRSRSRHRNRARSTHSLKLRFPKMAFIDRTMEAKPGLILIAVKI